MKNEINPVMAIVAVVVILLVAGGIWYYKSSGPGAGLPATGQAGRADPFNSGPGAAATRGARPPVRGGPGGPGGR